MDKVDYKRIFYPEITEHGNLTQALRAEFEKIESELKDKIEGLVGLPEVKAKQKHAGLMVAVRERLFLCSFDAYGIHLATGKTTSFRDVAIVMHNWLILNSKISDLVKDFNFITPNERNEPFEAGNYVEWNWRNYEKFIEKQFPELISVFQAAKKHQKLKEHIIFTSHNRLGFSNCKIGHVCFDVLISPLSAEQFRVSLKNDKEVLGNYSAERAAQLVAENIGNDCRACNEIK
jgi:hypothetical protein